MPSAPLTAERQFARKLWAEGFRGPIILFGNLVLLLFGHSRVYRPANDN